jgi:class 3 adenylate cyclase
LDWCSYFDFKFDPFFDKPLESKSEMENLLIIERRMDEQINPLMRQIEHVPFLCLILGERGVGKSTFIYYAMSLAEKSNALSVYVGLDHLGLEASPRPVTFIVETVLYEFGSNLLESALKQKSDFFNLNKNLLLSLAHYLGLTFSDSEGFLPSGKSFHLDIFELKRHLLPVLKLLKSNNMPVVLSLDNLDKVTKMEILEAFFTAPFAQSFFDELKKEGVSILIAMTTQFEPTTKKNPNLRYLSQTLILPSLSPPQSIELLTKRIKYYSNNPTARIPFNNEAIAAICIKTRGVTRDILTEARNLCIKAYEARLPKIDKKFVEKGLISFNESRTFYELLSQSEELRTSLLKMSLIASSSYFESDQMIAALKTIIYEENQKIDGDLLNVLLTGGMIKPITQDKYNLDDATNNLMSAVRSSGWNVDQFLTWIFSQDNIKIVAEGIPGLKAKISLDKFGPIPGLSKTFVKVLIRENEQVIPANALYDEAILDLKEAKNIMETVGKLTWDDIDNTQTYKNMIAAITCFLTSFSKLYICCASCKIVRLKSWKVEDLVENALHHFQEEFNVSSKSFHRYQRIRANFNGLYRGGFSPNISDVRGGFEDFTEIVTEFTGFWQGISQKFSALEPVDDQHGLNLKELAEIATLMGYSIERPEYNRFRIDGDRYFKMGLSSFPIDEATVDIVREKLTKDRLDNTQSYFFIGNVKADSRSFAKPTEVISFIQKCNDLIRKIESETSDSPKSVTKYLLVYVSSAGFERGLSSAMQTIVKNADSEIMILDYRAMIDLKRRMTPSRKIQNNYNSTIDITQLWSKDIEELLRLRRTATEVIHKKFEKDTTILLADMKDFTVRTQKDSIESAQAVQTMSDLIGNAVHTYDGIGFNTEGDSYIATFDKPEQAIMAALKSVNAINEYNGKAKEENRIFIHVGISFGEVMFKRDLPFVGTAVNLAARIMKEAEPNKVVITEKTYKYVCGLRGFDFVCLGSKQLKGFDKPITLYEVLLKEFKPLL